MVIGSLTIGQSPRSDVLGEIRDVIGKDVEIIERGALDELGLDEIQALRPERSDRTLITRMSDGTEVRVADRHIMSRLQECVDELEGMGAEILILLCTGEFPAIVSRKIFLRPYLILRDLVGGMQERGTLGVIIPSPEQIPDATEKWKRERLNVRVDAVSPYSSTRQEILETARRIKEWNADLVILDCIGFDREAKARFRQVTEKPVLLPRTILGGVLREMVECP